MSAICTPRIDGLDHTPGTRLVFGSGSVNSLGDAAKELGGTRVLLVSDAGLLEAGHVSRVEVVLEKAGLVVGVFTDVHENPTTDDVARCLMFAKTLKPDMIIGLGGGSSLDTAKGCNFLYTNGGAMMDYQGVGKPDAPMLPFIAVPTTHGTGSETQSFALIADADTHQKMACGDPKALPGIAVLDPELTLTQPKRVSVLTSIDAISHAVESYVCKRRNEVSCAYARESLRLTLNSYTTVLDHPDRVESRGDMLLGAAYAGLAIENSMLGSAHAAANPLTAHWGVTHGHAVGVMLPHVVRYNAEDTDTATQYDELAAAVGLKGYKALVQTLSGLLADAGLPTDLAGVGVQAGKIPQIAGEAAGQWTAGFNPRPMNSSKFMALYQAAYRNERL